MCYNDPMIWQDIVFTVGGWIFIIALIPSLIGKDKPAILTSLVSGVVLLSFSFSFFSLSFVASSIATGMTGAAWFILAFQKYIQTRDEMKKIKSNEQNI